MQQAYRKQQENKLNNPWFKNLKWTPDKNLELGLFKSQDKHALIIPNLITSTSDPLQDKQDHFPGKWHFLEQITSACHHFYGSRRHNQWTLKYAEKGNITSLLLETNKEENKWSIEYCSPHHFYFYIPAHDSFHPLVNKFIYSSQIIN